MNILKILIPACILTLTGCVNESGFGVGVEPDQYERNNEYETAEEYTAGDGYETDDDFSTGNAIVPGVLQDHTFHYDNDTDFILLDLTDITPPMTVTIETGFLTIKTNTLLFLYDATRSQIDFDDDSGQGDYAKIVWVCEDPSLYYIQVSEKNKQIGDYRITVTFTTPSGSTPIDT